MLCARFFAFAALDTIARSACILDQQAPLKIEFKLLDHLLIRFAEQRFGIIKLQIPGT